MAQKKKPKASNVSSGDDKIAIEIFGVKFEGPARIAFLVAAGVIIIAILWNLDEIGERLKRLSQSAPIPMSDEAVVTDDNRLRVDFCIFGRTATCVPTRKCYGPTASPMGFASDPEAREYSCKVACLESPDLYPHLIDRCDMSHPYPGLR